MTFGTKEEALDALEAARVEYLAKARAAGREIAARQGRVTVDDVRRVAPPPPEIDGRVMGAIFRCEDFVAVGREVSARAACHKSNPIVVYSLA